ncbi:hypothetical protein NLI96_g5353 [Meripilus lineatus]|uniref:Tyr recombinase domain-containing protein n=1 Tax=Meripilus lineatus TaxID=2056292 RepID=A0AAD5V585_9APHY|nr:hypothetical protein NLI96_g5353 [Physisporinus lineatus]
MGIAVKACACSLFHALLRAGEHLIDDNKEFSPSIHITIACVSHFTDPFGFESTRLHIPWTKVRKEQGEDVVWTRQQHPTCPRQALDEHIRINNPLPHEHLFSYTTTGQNGGRKSLHRQSFLSAYNKAATLASFSKVTGHCFRIGGTLEYLLRGHTFETVRELGRWDGDSFRRYLRRHAFVLSPRLHDIDNLHTKFLKHCAQQEILDKDIGAEVSRS